MRLRGLLGLAIVLGAWWTCPVHAQAAVQAAELRINPGEATAAPEATVFLHNRRIVGFRASLSGDTPAERAALARSALEAAVAQRGPGAVSRSAAGDAIRFELDGLTLFYLAPDDLPGQSTPALLDIAAQKVQARLNLAVREAQEMSDPRKLGLAAAYALGATAALLLVLRVLFALRRRAQDLLERRVERWRSLHGQPELASVYTPHVASGARFAAGLLCWLAVLVVADFWATFVLKQFAYTRAWGERSGAWLQDTLEQFLVTAVAAVPGLLTAVLIFVIARLLSRAGTSFMQRVERGEIQIGWLDVDTAGPTRRLGNVVVWLFALAMAYPYLPGAQTEAFKGLTVLAGLMLSLGASGVVGQAMSGISLMYSRSMRVGEYVKVGDIEGTVVALGLFTTKIHTGLGEEVSMPNTLVFSQSIRNFSRLVKDGQLVLHTDVSIGYDTPWRQVRSMLLEAARRTPGVAPDPAPYVVQTALADFYVVYRLCAQSDRGVPRRRAETIDQLHANILDVFNEQGVQIMSPHYVEDPLQAKVVSRESRWSGTDDTDGRRV